MPGVRTLELLLQKKKKKRITSSSTARIKRNVFS